MGSRRVAVFGLGYVGLPLIRACINQGHVVVGFDVNPAVVDGLLAGHSHVDDVTDVEVADWLTRGFMPTTSSAELTDLDVFVICVPTPLSKDGGPDLGAVIAATRTIAEHLERGTLVILESTTYPGTTEEVVMPILEESGLQAGVDFSLAFSPERIDPGNREFTFETTPKVVGGFSAACAATAVDFYADLVVSVVPVSGLKEAEMAKLLENTYRHVNIALVNELARLSHEMNIDIWEVIRAAETKPYGFHAFRPGPGVGGHCIPIDPNYLSHRVRSELGHTFRFVELAQDINHGMPKYVVTRTQELLNNARLPLRGSQVLILGVTYKPDVSDTRETPAIAIVRELRAHGALVAYHDPLVRNWVVDGQPVTEVADLSSGVEEADCAILVQAHGCYAKWSQGNVTGRVLDTRGLRAHSSEGVESSWIRL